MKKVLFFFGILFSFQINSQQLLLHYPFDGNSNDISGNSYNGNPNGITYVNDRNGNPNSAVYFDGVNDFIDFPNIIDLKPDLPVSISLWVKFDDLQPQNSVVFTTDFEEDNHSGVFMTISTSGKLAINYGDARGNTISSNRRSKLADKVISAGNWYHVAAIVKGPTDMDIFVNCIDANGSYSGTGNKLGYSSNSGSIGRKDANTNLPTYYFKGSIDEFKYYKGVIIPASEKTVFNNLETTLCEGSSYNLPTTSSNGVTGSWSPEFDNSVAGTTVYIFTPDTGQCATIIDHTVEVREDLVPDFNTLETTICEGSFYSLPTTSTNGITGNWSPSFDNSVAGTTVYTFTPDTGQCATIIDHTVEVSEGLAPNFNTLETTLCKETSYNLPTTSLNGITGSWSPEFDNSTVGTIDYIFTPDAGQCANNLTHSIKVTDMITPSFINLETTLCEGTSYSLPSTSSNGITGNWSPLFDNSTIGTKVYTFIPDTGQCGVSVDHSVEVMDNLIPNFINLEATLCEGSSYSLPTTSSNGIIGSWSPLFDNSIIGTTVYTFTPNVGQCAVNIDHSVEVRSNLTPSFSSLETTLCEGSSYSLPTTSLNGITGSWSPLFDNSIVGTTVYTFTPDTGICASILNHSIEVTNEVIPSFLSLKTILCVGTSYSLPTTSSNSISGSWLPIFDNSTLGTIVYTFTPNAGQCAKNLNHSIEVTDEIIPSFINLEATLCQGTSFSLPTTSSNGITGSWSPLFDNSTIRTTVYTFIPDPGQCGVNVDHSVDVKESLTPNFNNLETTLCEGSSYSLPTTSSNGVIGSWIPLFDNSIIGTTVYTFTPDIGQCGINVDHSIEVRNNVEPSFINLETTLCEGTLYNLPTTSLNGITGSWSPLFDNSIEGTTVYTFTPDIGLCANIINHSIEVTKEIIPSFSSLKTVLCEGTSYSLPTISSNGIIGSWSPLFDNSTLGTAFYTFIPDTDQCASNINHSIEVTNEIVPSFNNLEITLCEGTPYNLPTTSVNGITGSWSPLFDNSIIGTTVYTFIPDPGQCGVNFDHSVDVKESLTPNFNNLETTLCEGISYSLPIISSNGVIGSWSPLFDNLTIGTTVYSFTPDVGQCGVNIDYLIEITQKATPVFSTLPIMVMKNENYDFPSISDNGIAGNWSPLLDSSLAGEVIYTFTPSTLFCADIFTSMITVSNEIVIPLFFTPNNDNINDFWLISGLNSYTEVKFYIFDRYGKLLAEPNINVGWDGKYNGENMVSNDYWYLLSAVNLVNEIIIRKGNFSLLRR